MVKVNGIYDAKINFRNDRAFAKIKITYVRREKLGSIDNDGVRKEGCKSLEEFKKTWTDIYGKWDDETEVFVIGFSVVARLH